ncbi:MAG: hypothetical protein WAU49_08295 [Steroidobacteraceae bacterium]
MPALRHRIDRSGCRKWFGQIAHDLSARHRVPDQGQSTEVEVIYQGGGDEG